MTEGMSGRGAGTAELLRLLDASESRFRSIIEKSGDGVIVLYGDGSIAFVNPAAEELLNRPAEAILGRPFGIPLVPGETTELDIPGVKGIRGSLVVEMRVVETEWDGQPAILATLRDITERKRAEEVLRAAEERYRRLSEATSDFTYSLRFTPEGGVKLEWLTEAFTRLTGYTASDLRQREWRELIFKEDWPAVEAHLARIQNGQPDVCERRVLTRDGQVRWLRHSARPVRDPIEERIVHVYGAGQDVTERRRLELELRQRVQELANADQRKDQFLAMLAHELRNPLAPIRNAAHVLRLSENASTTDEMGRIIEQQVEHLSRLLDDLLDVSRITQGKITLRKRRIDLNEVAREAAEPLRGVFTQQGIRLEVERSASRLMVMADPVRMQQVVSNLLQNALKFSNPPGTVRVNVAGVGEEARLEVHDEGIGLAADQLAGIFEMFAQVDRSLDRNRGGLGIGLTLARELLEMHGGWIKATSEGLGKGSTFSVYLPLAEPVEVEDGEASAEPAGNGGGVARGGRRVLVVDDNVDASRSLATLLKMWGHEPSVVHDGPEALEHCRESHPEVVLLDIGLPRMDGYEVATRLLADPDTAGIVLIAMSGYGQEDDRRRSREVGFQHHLVKPLDLKRLATLLAELGGDGGG